MSLNIPIGFASAALVWTAPFGTGPFISTLSVDLEDYGSDFVGAANKVHASWVGNMTAMTSQELTFDHVQLTTFDGTAQGSVNSTLPAVAGEAGSASEVISMATCIIKQSIIIGRGGKGRMLVPGLLRTTDVSETGLIDTDKVDDIFEAFTEFAISMATDNADGTPLTPVLLHSEESGVGPTTLSGFSVRRKIGYVRGRLF